MLADRIGRITPSATLAMTAKAAELRATGKKVINLSVGEPDFQTPEHIKNAGKVAIDNGSTRYTPGGGTLELKIAACTKMKRDNNLIYDPSQVLVSCGGKHSLYNACQALFQKRDEVIIFSPYWVSFPDFVSVTGAKPVFVKTDPNNQYEPIWNDLKGKLNSNTKGIIINSPSNPTGGVWSDEAVIKVIKLAKTIDAWVFSDECYEQLTYDRPYVSTASLINDYDKILTFQSCSKTYAMTGWRIGYAAGNSKVINAMGKLQGQSTSCPNSIAQYAAIEALTGSQDLVLDMKNVFHKRRDLILSQLDTIPNIDCEKPNGAFYVFPDFRYYLNRLSPNGKLIKTSSDLSLYILDRTGVVTVAGDSFGAPNNIRLSYATSDDIIIEACNNIKAALLDLKN